MSRIAPMVICRFTDRIASAHRRAVQRKPQVFSGLMPNDKLLQEVRKAAVLIGTSLAELPDHVFRGVANPALGNVKADDSHGIDVLAFEQIGNHTFEVGIFDVGLAPRRTPFAVVIQNQIHILIVARNDPWRVTHYSLRSAKHETSVSLASPIGFLARHCRRIRIFDLYPILAWSRFIAALPTPRHDALQTHLAGLIDGRGPIA